MVASRANTNRAQSKNHRSKNEDQLGNFKEQLDFYKKKLMEIKKTYSTHTGKDVSNIYKSLSHMLTEAGKAYHQLESASEEEWDTVIEQVQALFKNLQKGFNEVMTYSAEHMQEYAHYMDTYSQEVMDSAEKYIKRNPLKSVLYAAGLGYVLGRFIK